MNYMVFPGRFWPSFRACISQFASVLIFICFCQRAFGISGAVVPWTTYEAESMTVNGAILGPAYTPNVVTSESTGRRCAQLSSTGHYIQFTAQATANSLVVRYSVQDSADGVGTDYTISLYKNGTFIGKLPVTSRYSWLYGSYPFVNTPGSSPRNFFDEARTNGVSISAGDVIRLQKDATDTAPYYIIDLVDLEDATPALSQPGGSVSIKSAPYNAVGDGVADDTAALQNCINGNNNVWIPPSTYKITGSISIPSNRTIRGAGMWYTTLVGEPSLYGSSNRRVTLNGSGSNIQLSDFAIIGKLNYRNDSEPNDGLGGSYGTGSTISRLWVEHTKVGGWIINSLGLVVDSCRFRNTIADGINFSVGMRSCTVTNCAARGTGDDCFAIWPATYTSQTYTPGLNVITHCTAQTPFLANGGAIYGGDSNRIEDCLVQDMPYGSGILFSTTFAVGANNFSGTTIAQRCDLNRCGGYDPGFTWRGAVQLCLDHKSMSGVNLNNLMITNSISDGVSIIAPGSSTGTGVGTLANAIMSNVVIPNYGLGTSGRHGLWARSDTIGSMTVSNSSIVEYQEASANFSFNFATSNVPVVVQTAPSGRSFSVDSTNYSTAQTFNWLYGSSHTISTTSPQAGGTGTQYVWSDWSDGGALSHSITATSPATNTASFRTQYFLTMNVDAGGSVTPANRWTNSGAILSISANASNGYSFTGWTGNGNGSYSGMDNPAIIAMNGPITQTAHFAPNNISVTVQPNPSGRSFTVDGTDYTNAQDFSWMPGSVHTIATSSPQSSGAGTRFVWSSWSNGGAISNIVAPATNTVYTVNFSPEYYLTTVAGFGGSVSPASGWYSNSAVLNVSATASNGYGFDSWSGSGVGSYSGNNNPAVVTLNGPATQSANFIGMMKTLNLTADLSFGPVPIGSSSNRVFTISNSGNAVLTVSSITCPTVFNGDWAGSIPPASSTNVVLTFSPLAATNYSGYVTVISDATSGSNALFASGIGFITNTPPAQSILEISLIGDLVKITYAATPGFLYHLETTTTISAPEWSAVADSWTNATANMVTFTDTNSPTLAPRFYRIISP
ncbi:InlB B-repeat-containing protein [Pedosphaera parvula]|uniref:Pectate lyase superfamily protein domain-containing protein n=1 Tax=Pedosphaera parvula (strain Ellin514) TaxID=320771 RepID=B9XHM4_PEDPL|nr:glycosyl hydrolase family 28-related protein [Pedosphaera parvula]EEF60602.1 hypothetical protein Cflav_PD6192 [Pedosphaera parvula Ellin514]